MMLHHVPRREATHQGAGVAAKDRAGASRHLERPRADVLDIRAASLTARLAASVKLARQAKGEK